MVISTESNESRASDSSSKQLDRKVYLSKLGSVNLYLQSLLQKRIRIDLEIKRTKKKLTKLKSQSSTTVRVSTELEQQILSSVDSELRKVVTEGLEAGDRHLLEQELALTDFLLEEVERLPLCSEE